MKQRIRRVDRSKFTNCRSPTIFAGWHYLKARNVRIDIWPQL